MWSKCHYTTDENHARVFIKHIPRKRYKGLGVRCSVFGCSRQSDSVLSFPRELSYRNEYEPSGNPDESENWLTIRSCKLPSRLVFIGAPRFVLYGAVLFVEFPFHSRQRGPTVPRTELSQSVWGCHAVSFTRMSNTPRKVFRRVLPPGKHHPDRANGRSNWQRSHCENKARERQAREGLDP